MISLGSLSTALMIPVALFLVWCLPQRRTARFVQAAGLAAMALFSVGGPLLVLGVLAFEVETTIAMMAALVFLSLWMLLVNRWLRQSKAWPYRLARFGELLGAGFLAGYVIVGLGLLLPWMSWPQLVVFGVGILVGLPGYLGIPVWFVYLRRYLGRWDERSRPVISRYHAWAFAISGPPGVGGGGRYGAGHHGVQRSEQL